MDKHTDRKRVKRIIENLLSEKALDTMPDLKEGIRRLEKDIANNEYRVTVVGEFSSGKSTFLNALIGKDVLPHGVSETTATVTYLHNVPESSPHAGKVTVHFSGPDIPDEEFDINASREKFAEFLTLKSERNVPQEIRSVDIFVNFLGNDEDVVVIDTPGLNGVTQGLREITLSEIARSHANIFLFGINGLKQSDIETVKSIYREDRPYFFVLNQIDLLNEETPEERIRSFVREVREKLIGKERKADIFGVSAFMALAARDTSIERLYNTSKPLTEEARAALLPRSGFMQLEDRLFDFIRNGEKETSFVKDILRSLAVLFKKAISDREYELRLTEADLGSIPAKEELDRIKTKVTQSIESNKTLIHNRLISSLKQTCDRYKQEIYKGFERIFRECNETVDGWNTVEQFEQGVASNKIPCKVNIFYGSLKDYLQEEIIKDSSRLYMEMVDEIERFVPKVKLKEGKRFHFEEKSVFSDQSFRYEGEIKKIETQILSIEDDLRRTIGRKKTLEQDKRHLHDREKVKRSLESERRSARSRLGSRPEYNQWKTTKQEERRFLFVFKYKKEVVCYQDNQADIDAWDRKKKETDALIRKIDAQIDTLNREIQRQKTNLNQEESELETKIVLFENKISRLEERKKEKMKEIEEEKKYARSSYLREGKRHLKDAIVTFISPARGRAAGEMLKSVVLELDGMVEDIGGQLEVRLQEIYDELVAEFLDKMAKMVQRIDSRYNVKSLELKRQQIKDNIDTLNRIYNESVGKI